MYALVSKANVFFRNAAVGCTSTIADDGIEHRVLTNKCIDQANKSLAKICVGDIWRRDHFAKCLGSGIDLGVFALGNRGKEVE